MDLELRGKAAVVTGGNAGIGRAIGRILAEEGCRVLLTGRNEETLASGKAEILDAGGEAHTMVADLYDDAVATKIQAAAIDALGQVDILVNNAGGSRPFGKDATEEQWDEALTLNFTRPRQIAHAFLEGMQNAGWGRIINITGKSEPEGVNGAFCAKAGIHSWAKGLSREVGNDGVTVNCIAPGRIMSDQIRRNYSPEYRAEQSRTEIPVGRYGEPEELANLAVFLSSPLAAYITGTMIAVDGGLRRYQF
ncbi:SDR family NAD(P)-dependent oxidoreductase [Hasllibacter sp. MH4015]|uniref:SDR family NAD(P)-dependent oxidoreductase n=1 Tax=Hasllibacter sp. MH4015 TaxID=2854029 RepID=UPI001CD72EF4|nr:SDR family oxidoreductase [Hasllibacter sp. MH4015]